MNLSETLLIAIIEYLQQRGQEHLLFGILRKAVNPNRVEIHLTVHWGSSFSVAGNHRQIFTGFLGQLELMLNGQRNAVDFMESICEMSDFCRFFVAAAVPGPEVLLAAVLKWRSLEKTVNVTK